MNKEEEIIRNMIQKEVTLYFQGSSSIERLSKLQDMLNKAHADRNK